MNLNLNSLAVSRMLAHYSWKEVIVTLEGYFVSKSLLNPFMDEKAVFLRISLVDKWRFVWLKIEYWSNKKHSYLE